MKYLTFLILLFSLHTYAEKDREGDLQLPISDVSDLERQEEEIPPTIDEIKMEERLPQQSRKEPEHPKEEKSSNKKK